MSIPFQSDPIRDQIYHPAPNGNNKDKYLDNISLDIFLDNISLDIFLDNISLDIFLDNISLDIFLDNISLFNPFNYANPIPVF